MKTHGLLADAEAAQQTISQRAMFRRTTLTPKNKKAKDKVNDKNKAAAQDKVNKAAAQDKVNKAAAQVLQFSFGNDTATTEHSTPATTGLSVNDGGACAAGGVM